MLFQKVFSYLANEVVTKTLANSRLFQRLAYQTHLKVSEVQQKGSHIKPPAQVAEMGKTVESFFGHLKNNLQKEFQAASKK